MERMEDLPMKPTPTPVSTASAPKRKATRAANTTSKKRPPTARQTTDRIAKRGKPKGKAVTSKTSRSQTVKTTQRPVKPLPAYRLPGEQPRDSLGRFASKVWSGTKVVARGTVRAVRGTAKTVKSTHKAIKRSNAAARRRANLEHRERSLALRERAAKLRGKSRRKAGKGKGAQGKQGLLSKLFGGRKR